MCVVIRLRKQSGDAFGPLHQRRRPSLRARGPRHDTTGAAAPELGDAAWEGNGPPQFGSCRSSPTVNRLRGEGCCRRKAGRIRVSRRYVPAFLRGRIREVAIKGGHDGTKPVQRSARRYGVLYAADSVRSAFYISGKQSVSHDIGDIVPTVPQEWRNENAENGRERNHSSRTSLATMAWTASRSPPPSPTTILPVIRRGLPSPTAAFSASPGLPNAKVVTGWG